MAKIKSTWKKIKTLPKKTVALVCPICKGGWSVFGNMKGTYIYFKCLSCHSLFRGISPQGVIKKYNLKKER